MPKCVYLACEYDAWQMHSSRVILGIFSTYNKALKALMKTYGKLVEDSKDTFIPLDNPNNVLLKIEEVVLNDLSEV